MSLKYGKGEREKFQAILEYEPEDGEPRTLGDVTDELLGAYEEIFEARAKFVVVGQLIATSERSSIPPDDPAALKLSLGWYSTAGDANTAAEALVSNASGDRFAVWVLPVHHGTPAALHAKQKAKYEAEAEKARAAKGVRLQKQIEKRRADAEERARSLKGACACGHWKYDHITEGSSYGKCGLSTCGCPKWNER